MGLSKLRLITFIAGGARIGVPLEKVHRVVRAAELTSLPGTPACILGILNLHGSLVPVGDARLRLALPARELSPSDNIVVVATRKRLLGLIAEGELDVRETSGARLSPTAPLAATGGYIPGIAQLDDGLVLVHDADHFLGYEEEQQLAEALGAHA